jgi:hypothetical protein
MKTATETMIGARTDELAARRTADFILNLLRDFIPRGCEREAWDLLAKAAYEGGFELTDKAMRKEYESWKKTQLEFLRPSDFRAQDPAIVGFPPKR